MKWAEEILKASAKRLASLLDADAMEARPEVLDQLRAMNDAVVEAEWDGRPPRGVAEVLAKVWERYDGDEEVVGLLRSIHFFLLRRMAFIKAHNMRGQILNAARAIDMEDLEEAALEGLLDALSRYSPKHGARPGTYANWWIYKYIVVEIQRLGSIMRLPSRYYQERSWHVSEDEEEDKVFYDMHTSADFDDVASPEEDGIRLDNLFNPPAVPQEVADLLPLRLSEQMVSVLYAVYGRTKPDAPPDYPPAEITSKQRRAFLRKVRKMLDGSKQETLFPQVAEQGNVPHHNASHRT